MHFRSCAVALVTGGLLMPFASPLQSAPPSRLSANDARAKALVARMTLDEKVGQMIQVERGNLVDEANI